MVANLGNWLQMAMKTSRRIFRIDQSMIPSKITNFLLGSLLGIFRPVVIPFLVSVGLSLDKAGLVNGVPFVLALFASFLWGMIVDHTNRRKTVFIILCIVSALSFFSLPWIAKAIQYAGGRDVMTSAACLHKLNQYSSTQPCSSQLTEGTRDVMTITLLCIMILFTIFFQPLLGFVSSILLKVIKAENKDFGSQIVYRPVGFVTASFVTGIATDAYTGHQLSQYTPAFFIFLIAAFLLPFPGIYVINQGGWERVANDETDIVEATVVTIEENVKESAANEEAGVVKETENKKTNVNVEILNMFRQIDTIVFMISVLITGLAINTFFNFSVLLLKDEIAISNRDASLLFVVANACELIAFFFTSRVLKRLGGPWNAIIVGLFSYFVRFLVMAYTTQLWLVIAIQALHSIGFSLTYDAILDYVHEHSPPSILQTMTMTTEGIKFSLAEVVANIIGGYIYQFYGGRTLFIGNAMVCGVWGVFLVFYCGIHRLRQRCVSNE